MMSITKEQALSKLMKYCSLQERCKSEILIKLEKIGCPYEQYEFVIQNLIELNFLNEKRFCEAYARGKFNFKKWGKQKIRASLRKKGLSIDDIEHGLKEVSQDQYRITIKKLAEKKIKTLTEKSKFKPFEIKVKAAAYLQQKGYDYYDIQSILDEFLN
jgi:regulatory protein